MQHNSSTNEDLNGAAIGRNNNIGRVLDCDEPSINDLTAAACHWQLPNMEFTAHKRYLDNGLKAGNIGDKRIVTLDP